MDHRIKKRLVDELGYLLNFEPQIAAYEEGNYVQAT